MSDEQNLLQQRSIQQSIGQNLANSKELQEHNLNQQKPSQELTASPQTTASSTKTSDPPVKTRVSSEKPFLTEQELKRTVENTNLPNKT